jgi:hypothetical protein
MEPTRPKVPRKAIALYNLFIHGEITRLRPLVSKDPCSKRSSNVSDQSLPSLRSHTTC